MNMRTKITKREMKEHGEDKGKKKTFIFTIPERYLASDILIMAGNVPIAIKPHWSDQLSIKTSWCNNCGECCMLREDDEEWELGSKFINFRGKVVRVCEYASKITRGDGSDGILCSAGPLTPWACIIRTRALLDLKFPSCSLDYDRKYEIVE